MIKKIISTTQKATGKVGHRKPHATNTQTAPLKPSKKTKAEGDRFESQDGNDKPIGNKIIEFFTKPREI